MAALSAQVLMTSGLMAIVLFTSYTVGQTYVGCFADCHTVQNIRDMPYGKITDRQLTVKRCTDHCANLGYQFAAMQNGIRCRCDNSYGSFGKSTKCNMPCRGNNKEKCGGLCANSVYAVGSVGAQPTLAPSTQMPIPWQRLLHLPPYNLTRHNTSRSGFCDRT